MIVQVDQLDSSREFLLSGYTPISIAQGHVTQEWVTDVGERLETALSEGCFGFSTPYLNPASISVEPDGIVLVFNERWATSSDCHAQLLSPSALMIARWRLRANVTPLVDAYGWFIWPAFT